ncbi:hypothetical protein FRC06_000430 [Ceratobasidium sp. 370]|nr:hypothetical protein FRC06_000430 [Ceratobasidium sp. 370]
MIPKLATNLLHLNVQRAAAAVRDGASTTLRNLQLQSVNGGSLNWAGAGSSSSGWGSAGGTKYSAGSKFYQGYTVSHHTRSFILSLITAQGPGRAITHANAEQHDEFDDPRAITLHPRRARARALQPRDRRGRAASLAPSPADLRVLKNLLAARAARPDGVRYNSTIARELPSELDLATAATTKPDDLPPVRTGLRKRSKSMSALPEMRLRAADSEPLEETVDRNMRDWESWDTLRNTNDPAVIRREIHRVRTEVYPFNDQPEKDNPKGKGKAKDVHRTPQPSVTWFNAALGALYVTRTHGQPVTDVVRLYNDMIARGVLPNAVTYATVIAALCERDWEVVRALQGLDNERIRATINTDAPTGKAPATLTSVELLVSPALVDALPHHAETIRMLRAEIHLPAALALFHAAAIFRGFARLLPLATYSRLLRACAARGERGGAVRVWEVLERRETSAIPNKGQYIPAVFRHLIATYTTARDIGGAEEVFAEWLKSVASGQILGVGSALTASWSSAKPERNVAAPIDSEAEDSAVMATTGGERDVWDEMIVAYASCGNGAKAVEMVEWMMDGRNGAPKPTSVTFSRMIRAFCDVGDVNTAYAWFERLRSMGVTLASEAAEFLVKTIVPHLPTLSEAYQVRVLRDLTVRLVGPGTIGVVSDESAVGVVEDRAAAEIVALKFAASGVFSPAPSSDELVPEQNMAMTSRATTAAVDELIRALYAARQLTLGQHIRVARVWCRVTSGLPHELPARGIVDTLASAEEGLESADWELVSNAFATVLANEGPVTDAALAAFSRAPIDSVNWRDVARGAVSTLGYQRTWEAMGGMGQEVLAFIDTFGPKAESPVETAASTPQSPETAYTSAAEDAPLKAQETETAGSVPPSPALHIDPLQSKFIDEYTLPRSSVTPLDAFARFLAGLHIGRLPAPETIGRLINALGRLGAVDKVQFLYSAGQQALTCLENDKAWQAQAWFQLEDQMIGALAHAERPEAAAVHKARIIAQGGAPSADAYGALIAAVKNTTDDAQVARELFEEARKLGVPANIFLYNTVISKAARARKAEYALELFHEMRAAGLRPTSVTYGAIIGACCRVGDAETASYLFAEMSSMPNFRPRVPPYNTMMQFFVTTKPNRERCLDYYQAMVDARVAPSAHTYKLLLDCYGTIEPIDLPSMEDVFKRLQQDRHVSVQGAHWAALINAYGCAAHDLDRALSTFDRIPAHAQPDAVAFEALFNAIVMHHRVDLVPAYLERMSVAGVHMTAYISNLLIKGYAAAGQLERARGVFDAMNDPPVGLAAVHNHPGHTHAHGSEGGTVVPVGAPVFREPSTWEAMVRAELGAGEKERAAALLDRMEDRMFPVAVTSRIRSIMGEDGSLVEPPQPVSA